MSIYDSWDAGMDTCPICNKKFIHNPYSIYKLRINDKLMFYCSYTCWRKDGGDTGSKYTRYNK